jgi:hypothetical protein
MDLHYKLQRYIRIENHNLTTAQQNIKLIHAQYTSQLSSQAILSNDRAHTPCTNLGLRG